MTTRSAWKAALLLSVLAILALGYYALVARGTAPLALLYAAPFVVLCHLSIRRLRAPS